MFAMTPMTQVTPANKSADLMTPREVAILFRVSPKTVARWAEAHKLRVRTTAGGHRRYFREDVEALLGDTQ